MTQNFLNDSEEDIIIIMTKRSRGRPINPDRHLPDGSYNKQCLDPEYAKKYYYKTFRVNYTCTICGKELATNQKIKRHENSAFCLKAKLKLEA